MFNDSEKMWKTNEDTLKTDLYDVSKEQQVTKAFVLKRGFMPSQQLQPVSTKVKHIPMCLNYGAVDPYDVSSP